MKNRLETYIVCMNEFKYRFVLAEKKLEEFEGNPVHPEVALDLVALQLRKMIELVGFASMGAHLEKYKSLKPAFSKEWSFKEIIRRIEKINPDCTPKPVERRRSGEKGVNWHYSFPIEKRLTVRDLISWHGRLDVFAHARNPFKSPPELQVQLETLNSILEKLGDHVWHHLYMVEDADSGFIIELNAADEAVSVVEFKAQGENDVH